MYLYYDGIIINTLSSGIRQKIIQLITIKYDEIKEEDLLLSTNK